MINIPYGFGKETDLDFSEAVERTRQALKSNGFGVLTEIDMRDAMKKKLGVDFRNYVILGACNPPFAHRALSAEINLGLLLPCNVVIYENDRGRATVMVMDPAAAMSMIDNPEVAEVAAQVQALLEKVMAAI